MKPLLLHARAGDFSEHVARPPATASRSDPHLDGGCDAAMAEKSGSTTVIL